jgi:hypothetical protein
MYLLMRKERIFQDEMYLLMRKERIFQDEMFLSMRKERKSLRSLTTTGKLSLFSSWEKQLASHYSNYVLSWKNIL